MVKAVRISRSSVRRIWAGQGLQPHQVRTFKISNDPTFADKLKDVVRSWIFATNELSLGSRSLRRLHR
jgi:hypothetical protein